MKLKLDENGHVVVKDGFPVWVAEDGAEIAYNVPDLVNKISAVNAESAGRRKDIDALTSQLKAFDGIDPEKAKAALETVANLDAGKLIDAGKVDDLKMEIKKSYDGKISDLEKALADSKKDSADRLAAKEASIRTHLRFQRVPEGQDRTSLRRGLRLVRQAFRGEGGKRRAARGRHHERPAHFQPLRSRHLRRA